MNTLDLIRGLYDYNEWANNHVLEEASLLSEDELSRELGASHGSVQGALTHMLVGQVFWLGVWGGSQGPVAMPRQEPGAVIRSLRGGYERYHEQVRAFLDSLTEADLPREILDPLHDPRMALPLAQQLIQIATHGIHHRSEVAALLTAIRGPVRDLDYLFFERERQQVPVG
jgi:uncharacterized damage-inducible protein DinB